MLAPTRLFVLVAAIPLMCVGCTTSNDTPEEEGPSYKDLVVIYNAELETLDRLEQKREKLIEAYEAAHRPDAQDALNSIAEAVRSAGELRQSSGDKKEIPADPEAALDQAVAGAEQAQQVAAKLFQSMTQPSDKAKGSAAQEPVPYSEEFKQQLAELDAEIEAQKARVERARQARDAAENKRLAK